MKDWNVVVSVYEGHFHQAVRFLERFGWPAKTDYFNVVVMQVEDVGCLLDYLKGQLLAEPALESAISRVMPASMSFDGWR